MVCKVIYYSNAAPLTSDLLASFYPPALGKTIRHLAWLQAKFSAEGQDRQGIECIVSSRKFYIDIRYMRTVSQCREPRSLPLYFNIGELPVIICISAVPHHPRMRIFTYLAYGRPLGTGYKQAFSGNNLNEAAERPFYRLDVCKYVGMIKFNTGKYGTKWSVMQEFGSLVKEGRVIFVSLKYKPRRPSLPESRIVALQHAAYHKARFKTAACIKG